MTIQEIRKTALAEIKKIPNLTQTPELDVDLIIGNVLKKDRTWLMFHRTEEVLTTHHEKIFSDLEKRKTGLPIAYITGHKEFFGLDFFVTSAVLIPKPDTELLVELGIQEIQSLLEKNQKISICDMCSGSGCVGISAIKSVLDSSPLFTDGKKIELTFVDISQEALKITRQNAERILLENENQLDSEKSFKEFTVTNKQTNISLTVTFILSNLFEFAEKQPRNLSHFHLILTNPPYVPHSESVELLKDGRSEPLLALDGDVTEAGKSSGTNDGLALIRRLVPQCYTHLEDGCKLIMETGEYNAEETSVLFENTGFQHVHIKKDMNEMLRDVVGTKSADKNSQKI